jgi:hypothetical protein
MEGAANQAWTAFTGQVRRTAEEVLHPDRRPAEGDWRASDYDPRDLDAMIDTLDEERRDSRAAPARRGANRRDAGAATPWAGARPRDSRGTRGWDDEAEWERDWDAGWETGTWDAGWTQDGDGAGGGWDDEDDEWNALGDHRDADWAHSLVAVGAASMAELPVGRLARFRMLRRERPAAATMLLVFMLGFVLTCVAPLVPLARLGWDVADAAHHATDLQTLAQDPQKLIQPATLKLVQDDVNAIEHDLYEINAAANIAGAPLAAASSTLRNYRLLIRMGYDLTAAADEGLQVGQTLLTPLQGGALSTSASSPGLTPDDIQQARTVLADAQVHVEDAVAAYNQINQLKLPAQLRPGSKYGSLLSLLPLSVGAFNQLNTLLTIAPAMLGIGQPANYIVIAMDRSELRAGGGFQGNYGILTLKGGKQPADEPLSLVNTYDLDQKYYDQFVPDKTVAQQNCANTTASQPDIRKNSAYNGPEPPKTYWWWPYSNFSWCWNWGLRDSNLSPDFPTNARAAMAIVQATSGSLLNPGPIQGVVGFTPQFIGDLLQLPDIGSITLSEYPKDPPVTAQNLELEIHCHQLPSGTGCPPGSSDVKGGDRKTYTHLLSQALLARIKTLHGNGLKAVIESALTALKNKDLQVYFADPRAELMLQQLGLGAQINTGGGDGFFVVDTNDGANKANLYVSETQQDLVTLLPNGGAIHRLRITVNYNYPKNGWVYADPYTPEDYNDVQRVYMPGDATLLGFSGFAHAPVGVPQGQTDHYQQNPINDCITADFPDHCLDLPVTESDVAGRTMVMGLVNVSCHDDANGTPMYYLYFWDQYTGSCHFDPHANSQVINVAWYSPNAWIANGKGGGSYTELIEKQAGTDGPPSTANPSGSVVAVTVLIDSSQLKASQNPGTDWTDEGLRAQALAHAKKVFDGPLTQDTATPEFAW